MMSSTTFARRFSLVGILLLSLELVSSFTPQSPSISISSRTSTRVFSEATVAPKGFGAVQEKPTKRQAEEDTRPVDVIKDELVNLIPSMTGQEDEFRRVEQLVNALEDKYTPSQTLGFLNLAMAGEWQLLFSTNLASPGNPAKFRLRELFQKIETSNLKGTITNQAVWDLADDQDFSFDATGTFSVVCPYTINQGARMVVEEECDHVLRLGEGSKVPKDVQGLVGRLHRAMPKELFDPQDHAMDTTYLDVDLRIVRMTGPRLEGVRGIFMRRGSLQIDPTATTNNSDDNNNSME
ncbi:expressed unknown protein [Seminavis robusta]|uniref:Plastid lipid-associated protein/fibrillin conserved domain-containing protein n=1 Tax=Seminavis robusta TaxID=568900 RepID=A0A9N8HGP4_9STRA|nr:expressed unknown protein [Seminavis robusta]|eukprot:Sro650_g181300.1 n/a (294) ;mRNA; r:1946-2827